MEIRKQSTGLAEALLHYMAAQVGREFPMSEEGKKLVERLATMIEYSLLDAELLETIALRAMYHHLEEWERPLKFSAFMDKRVSHLEKRKAALDGTPNQD